MKIVYSSNTGFTKRYAELLGEKTGFEVFELNAAGGSLSSGEEVIYLGWLMAGFVKNLKKAQKRFKIMAVCGVCLGDTGSQTENVRNVNKIPNEIPVFTLQGGMKREELRGINKFMINMLIKGLSGKQERTSDEEKQLELLRKGGDYVSEDNLKELLEFLK